MVRLVDSKNLKKLSGIVFKVLKLQECFTKIVEVNNPNIKPCLYAFWHAHQFAVHGLPHRANTNVLVSRSKDGELIAEVVEKWGFKTIRGSKGHKGAVEATMQMIDALHNGENCAMMIDGPKGPAKRAKDGIIKIAKLAGVPVIPVYWYSPYPNWIHFNSWDKLRLPVFIVNLINLYGEPIYVPKDGDENSDKLALENLQKQMEDLEARANSEFKKVYKFGLWERK